MSCVHELHQVSGENKEVCIKCGWISSVEIQSFEDARWEIAIRGTYSTVDSRRYERKNHFMSVCYQLFGISNLKVPLNVLDLCKNCDSLKEVREVLKKNKLSQYVSNANCILECVHTKYVCVQTNRQTLEKLLKMFLMVERVWLKMKDSVAPDRKAFLNYNFVLIKLCALLHVSHLCRDIKKIKSTAIKKKMELYWQLIMDKLCWTPTVTTVKKHLQPFPVYQNKWNPSKQHIKNLATLARSRQKLVCS